MVNLKRNVGALILVSFMMFLLAACEQQPTTTLYSPQATLTAASASSTQATNVIQQQEFATKEAYVATAENLELQALQQSVNATGTMQSIQANATATALHQLARVEEELANQEIRRQENLREAERIDLLYKHGIEIVMIAFWVTLIIIAAVSIRMARVFLERLTAPVVFQSGTNRAEIPKTVFENMNTTQLKNNVTPFMDSLPEKIVNDSVIELPRMDKGHVLVAGETGSGKTTAMKAVLKDRRDIVILDPHDDGQTWNAKVIGTGRDFESIQAYLENMQQELDDRFQQRANGRQNFQSLTVATDEVPAIVDEIGKDFGIIWRRWLREGRKVGLYIVVATQSTRVQTLGIKGEGDLLDNFTYVIELGKQAQKSHPKLTAGQERPAVVTSIDGEHPVIIPYKPELIAPPVNNMRSPDTITEADKKEIIRLFNSGESISSIATKLYGYRSGAAFYAVKSVLDKND